MVSARSSNANGLSCKFQQTHNLHQLLLFSLIRSSEQFQIISAISWAVVGGTDNRSLWMFRENTVCFEGNHSERERECECRFWEHLRRTNKTIFNIFILSLRVSSVPQVFTGLTRLSHQLIAGKWSVGNVKIIARGVLSEETWGLEVMIMETVI